MSVFVRSDRDRGQAHVPSDLPPVARGPVLAAMVTVGAALTIATPAYGYHRDELYFRMLPLQWGYVDQPPLTPLIARTFSAIADETWALHVPATLFMVVSIMVVSLIARELGGGRAAQTLSAWAYGTSLLPLEFARVLLTATLDLVVWPLVILFVLRAVLRHRPQWWLAVGLVVGLSMYNKLLIALLVLGLAAAVAMVGPRRLFVSRWVWAGAGVALIIGAPNLIYQATHDWPQLAMGDALARHNGDQVRLLTVPILLVMLGLPLVPIWGAGLVALVRRPEWRPVRFVAVALPVVLLLVFVGGTQFYYSLGLMSAILAAGCVTVGAWMGHGSVSRRRWVVAGVAVNAAISVVIALPVVPAQYLQFTPIPAFNQIAQDQIGWPEYVRDVARVRATLAPSQRSRTVVIADNYGQAGAVARYGPQYGITEVFSAQNELYYLDRPPEVADTAIVIGAPLASIQGLFSTCRLAGRLDNTIGVDNEEQNRPISICEDPIGGWVAVWPKMQHYD
ncbi:glycosyltransferase family 39 protein [Aeromicrobium sp. CF3.5]|uniref:glycosyltransferase family 39 protein n=1 Tax=Aeromicrobium sp. CF3.5 TaxID=3373078 RepID=UPI003EE603BC